MIRRPVFLTSALALAAAPALADDVQSGIAACEAALEAAAAEAYPDARFQFQQTRGGGLKKMAFRMTWNEESGTARCTSGAAMWKKLSGPVSSLTPAPRISPGRAAIRPTTARQMGLFAGRCLTGRRG
ncbi:MAG: hypothetical protein AAFX03_01955 [Pseudomonadota bacterium]